MCRRLQGRLVSEYGGSCHWDGAQGRGAAAGGCKGCVRSKWITVAVIVRATFSMNPKSNVVNPRDELSAVPGPPHDDIGLGSTPQIVGHVGGQF